MKDRYFELKNLVVAILLLTFVVGGCKKGDQSLGIGLLPGVKIFYTGYLADSTSISTSIFTDPEIRVDRPAYDLLGSFNDPVFGRTEASFAVQFRLPYHPAYPKTSALDSIVLSMTYKKIYGDTVSRQTLNVYQLAGDLNYETKYMSSFNLKSLASPDLIGTGSFYPKFRTDSLQTDTTEQVIRVRLNPSFGNSMLGLDSLKMLNNEEFLKNFKGLFIEAAPISRRGTLVSVNTLASQITLFYHSDVRDTLGFAYNVSANSANVASFSHDYTQAKFHQYLNSTNNDDSLIYVQPTAGIRTQILVPSLSSWKDSTKDVINEASLIFHVDTIMSDYRRYSMPPRLYLVTDSAGVEVFPKDSKISSNYYGGFYEPISATYIFNVTQHLQQIIGGLENRTFYLVSTDRIGTAQRVVLKGLKSFQPVKLAITYTRNK